MSLTQAIRAEAYRLGFSLAGFTTPDPPPHWSEYQHWLAMGRHGSMQYLEDPRRSDPRSVLPGCRTILLLALSYPNPGPAGRSPGMDRGIIAAYAWGRDYHLVFPERMKSLVAIIESRLGAPVVHRWYTDTGPLLERDLAQRAGLGWIGKNTCLINPRLGSFFLLGEILLGIELDPDAPFTPDRCGTCMRCIQACPTGCILPDRTLDARRCISYLTIENKKEIPPELRQSMENLIFGCDICQQVCPWNRFAGADVNPALDARMDLPTPLLADELILSPQQFNLKFKESPVLRSKRRGYLRNIAVALGNAGALSSLPVLDKAAREEGEPLIREHAAWAIARIKEHISSIK